MPLLISKTNFLEFLQCPKNMWLRLHKPELCEKFTLSDFALHLVEQGNEVESCAHNLFPGGIEIASNKEHGAIETSRLMASKIRYIFQATFIIDGFIARNDVLAWDEANQVWDVYEVKGTNALKEGSGADRDHISDVAFQVSVLKRSHVPLGKYHVIHLNKEYVRQGELDMKALFQIDDVTDQVNDMLPEFETKMEGAKLYLSREEEPAGSCDCIYLGRARHCTTFSHSNPEVPDYSVHDISRIHAKKLNALIDMGVFQIEDIPDDFELSEKQRNQIHVRGRKIPIIDKEAITDELNKLSFPLYFFDYEAFGPAIPAFDNYRPYNWIPFQFSLHILRTPNGELEHVEFLHEELSDPSEKVAALLQKHIDPKGTVIVWHKSFEGMVNKAIGVRLPQYAALFEQINAKLYDLEDIFTHQHYVHDDFKGRSSIKKVLPVLAPHLSYEKLDIKAGGQASDAWWKMVSAATSSEEKQKIAKDLKIYCGLDTYAMVVIWQHLVEQVGMY